MSNGLLLGRSRECDVVFPDPTVSGHHARLAWSKGALMVTDLGSANGTWVAGDKIERAIVRPGDDVLLGSASLPWDDERVVALLRERGRHDTVVATMAGRSFVCGRCGARGFLPKGIEKAELHCGSCNAYLELDRSKKTPPSVARRVLPGLASLALIAAIVAVAVLGFDRIAGAVRELGKNSGAIVVPTQGWEPPVGSPQEESIRAHTADQIVAAIDPATPATRNLAARLAGSDQGEYHVGQVAAIWAHVRGEWQYVNDPRGGEYFARASETIENEFVGDCDDFATLLVAMIEAVGGDARVVVSDGSLGGHAYAEACIHDEPSAVVERLQRHYRTRTDRAARRTRVSTVHYRSDATCPVWLNLDWNTELPGGPYGTEEWAVAVYPDGKTETLAPASAPAAP